MKVAIVHDSICEFGGAERFLQTLLELFPKADVHTLYYRGRTVHKILTSHQQNIQSSWIQYFPAMYSHTSLIQALSPFLWNLYSFTNYDLVISSSVHLLSNTIATPDQIHLQYIHSLPKNLVGMQAKTRLQTWLPYTNYVLSRYQKALTSTPYILSNSRHTQQCLRTYFQINSEVIYPPVSIPSSAPSQKRKRSYFLCVSRIDPTKDLELLIRAANHLNIPLKIVGNKQQNQYAQKLEYLSGPTIEWLGWVPDHQLSDIYARAQGFIFPARQEDFGIAPIEAMAHGVPILGYYGGGLKETIQEGETGMFFYSHSQSCLIKAIRKFKQISFNSRKIYEYSKQYSKQQFKKMFRTYLHQLPLY